MGTCVGAPSGKLCGIIPVVPTPFTAGDEVDLEALAALIEFAAGAGVPAVCLPAYGSEFYKLSDSERRKIVNVAIKESRGRVKVVAQSNHPSTRLAAELARLHQDMGADVISFAIPRQFALGEDDILRYCESVAGAVSVPVLIQDFNPGGPSVGAEMAARLVQAAGNIRYLKLEEPLMGAKVRAIRTATHDQVSVLEGWGGMYLLELMADGIAGAMPGLSMCDLFVRVFSLASTGDMEQAFELYRFMLPQIVFSLQNMELFHHCEKRLLHARGLLASVMVREPQLHLDSELEHYSEVLNREILKVAARLA